jgi:hypothetical protein|tara:strand:+ start:223 stop:576 length:354 start_codon:yes stop_codon:yes gene_type:complete
MENIERVKHEFHKMKKAVQRKYKGCELKYSNGNYTIQLKGKNVINSEWPDLQYADSVYKAYKNAFICEHWDRQKLKGDSIIANTITNMVGNTSSLPVVESYEYHSGTTEIIDEDNLI